MVAKYVSSRRPGEYCLASRIVEQNKKLYDWVTLVPGLGHLNMNQLKGFFKVNNFTFVFDRKCL